MRRFIGRPKPNDIALVQVDLDSFIYKAAFIAQKKTYFVMTNSHDPSEPPELIEEAESYLAAKAMVKGIQAVGGNAWMESEDNFEGMGVAVNALLEMVRSVETYLQAYEYQYFMTGEGNFRDEVSTLRKYKGNREGREKPALYEEVRQWAIDRWEPQISENCEADDLLSQLQWDYFQTMESGDYGWEDVTCVASIDKDLRQCPGLYYNPNEKQLEWISLREAELWFYTQLMAGDSTDHIQGIPGVGVKTAGRLLAPAHTPEEMEKIVKRRYEGWMTSLDEDWTSKYSVTDVMRENGQLVRMQRYPDERWEPMADETPELTWEQVKSKIIIGGK